MLVGGHGSRAVVTRRGIQSDRGYKVETAFKKKKELETPRDSAELKGKSAVEGAEDNNSDDGFKYKSGEHKSEVDPLENGDFITAQSGVDIDEILK